MNPSSGSGCLTTPVMTTNNLLSEPGFSHPEQIFLVLFHLLKESEAVWPHLYILTRLSGLTCIYSRGCLASLVYTHHVHNLSQGEAENDLE